jgi:hypothetical protein
MTFARCPALTARSDDGSCGSCSHCGDLQSSWLLRALLDLPILLPRTVLRLGESMPKGPSGVG